MATHLKKAKSGTAGSIVEHLRKASTVGSPEPAVAGDIFPTYDTVATHLKKAPSTVPLTDRIEALEAAQDEVAHQITELQLAISTLHRQIGL